MSTITTCPYSQVVSEWFDDRNKITTETSVIASNLFLTKYYKLNFRLHGP
jgi:hypothetical protein